VENLVTLQEIADRNDTAIKEPNCYGRLTIVSDVDSVGVVLNIDGGNVQELDYVEVRTTERWINTQGEMVRWQGLYKVCQRLSGKCRDSTKYAQEWMYKGCCRGSTKYTTRTK
jgi:hypothetical protein